MKLIPIEVECHSVRSACAKLQPSVVEVDLRLTKTADKTVPGSVILAILDLIKIRQ